MEEVDKILIHSLRQTGTDVSEEIQSVKQFTSELIVEAVLRCIRVIDPALGSGLPPSLPPGMSARFRVGMGLAQACQDLGYKGEIGYQTFLYSNEPEIRSLLMFLVEKLPRERADGSDQPAGKSVVLQRAIAAEIKAQLSLPWLPPNCRLPILSKRQGPGPCHRFHAQPLTVPQSVKGRGRKLPKEVTDYHRDFLLPLTAQPSQHAFVAPSILERNAMELSAAQEWDNEWNSQGLLSRLTPEEYRSRKRSRLHKRIKEHLRSAAQQSQDNPIGGLASGFDLSELLQSTPSQEILTKGTRFTHTQKFTFTQKPDKPVQLMLDVASSLPGAHRSDVDVQALQQEELATMQQQFQQLNVQTEEMGGELRQLTVTLQQVSSEFKQKELGNLEKEQSVHNKRQTMDLMPDAESNMVKLQALVESSANRVVNLASQWEKRRVLLIDEHRRLKEICSNREMESSRKLSEIKDLHDKIRSSTEEAKRREGLHKQLVTELETLPKDVSRSAYTLRILEIVGNIRKQNDEITKILSDTKELQKGINNLTGKLDRTFAVTDELVFKDAKKDESVRKSYKYLAALHENCTQLIQTIEDTGTILREIRDLEEQIETENSKKTVANLERILDDFKSMRQENSALAAKIREG
ncbi:coiled-coil domain-containing protein 22 [Aplochiton taeniatus]